VAHFVGDGARADLQDGRIGANYEELSRKHSEDRSDAQFGCGPCFPLRRYPLARLYVESVDARVIERQTLAHLVIGRSKALHWLIEP
jgi:hypothetical protein